MTDLLRLAMIDKNVIMISINHISAGYHDKPVLRDVSFDIAKKDILCILGPNGAGKTTLLRTLSRSLKMSGGSIQVMGRDINQYRRRELAEVIAVVPSNLNVPVAYTVYEFVAMGRTPYVSGWSQLSAKDCTAIEQSLHAVDLMDMKEQPLDELSSGERQRAMVAMALAQEPKVLLMDEPTAHLDIQHAWGVMELVTTLHKERALTVVMTSHDLNLAAEFCTRLVLLEKGCVAAVGSVDEMMEEGLLSRVYQHPLRVVKRSEPEGVSVVPLRAE